MSIKLKDLRTRIARFFPSYFDACFAKVYDKRALDTVVDVAQVAMLRIKDLEDQAQKFAAENIKLTRRIAELEAPTAPASATPEPTTGWFVRLEDIPGAEPSGSGRPNPPGINLLGMIRAVRNVTTLGLKEAKDIVDMAREGRGQTLGPFTAEKASELHRELSGCGGKAVITPGRKS